MSAGGAGRPSAVAIDDLVAAAREARDRAYAPYSNFHVGAAILANGRAFTGVNVEIASYPLSVCAERNAAAAAVMAGVTSFDAVAVVTDDKTPTPPCGGCRQVLHEFGPKMLVVSEVDGGQRAEWTLPDLLPAAFDAASLQDR
ncbi:MAG TPA: cytidine deaminase [Actinomycetota bacterium]|nr:cytidine deaminase [Actinomycetota bacterium]